MHDGWMVDGLDNVDIEVDGHLIEFSGYINGQDYECDAAAVENVNIWSCISMLKIVPLTTEQFRQKISCPKSIYGWS